MGQMTALVDPAAKVVAFPGPAPANETATRQDPDDALISALRRAARDHQVCAPLPLDRLAAAGPAGAPQHWARALVATASRGARLVFHRSDQPMVSATECWLASLVAATRDGDGDSARFLTQRFVAKEDRRLAICFAQRLAATLEMKNAA